jgi:hypothetical protein
MAGAVIPAAVADVPVKFLRLSPTYGSWDMKIGLTAPTLPTRKTP